MEGINDNLLKLREDVLAGVAELDFRNLDRRELLSLQFRLGMGNEWGVWEVPKELMADGQLQGRGQRVIEIGSALPSGMARDCSAAEEAWLELLRYGVVRSLCSGTKGFLKPSSVCSEMKILARLVRKVLEAPEDGSRFWSRITEAELSGGEVNATRMCRVLSMLSERQLIPDAPIPLPKVEGNSQERERWGEESPILDAQVINEWQPLPDVFTSECGWRSLYIIKFLGPVLLDVLERALDAVESVESNAENSYSGLISGERASLADEIVRSWKWMSPDGVQLNQLGFDVHVAHTSYRDRVRDQRLPVFEWPPRTFSEAWKLLNLVQGAHLFPVCLSSGPRASEVSSFTEECLVEVESIGYRINGKTYKLADKLGGVDRDFPAPDIVVIALLQQIRLARLVKRRSGVKENHLWVHVRTMGRGKMGEKQVLLSQYLDIYAKKVGVHHLLGCNDKRLHVHRFRKTLARVVALALVNAPAILMDCFGHEDPEMTLRRYILSDRSIARDVLEVQRELVILMAVEAVNNADFLGGAAAEKLRKRKADFLLRLGKAEFEPQDAYEFARRETFNGRSWMIVSPGVYCTLPGGNGGPCSKGQSGTNPAYCQSGCQFQILTEHSKVVVEDAVSEIVNNLQRAVDDDEPMLIAQWAGQLKNWLYRWSDIAERWEAHPLIVQFGKGLESP